MKRRSRGDTTRRKAWKSIRILRHFTVAGVCRTVPDSKYANIYKFVAALARHGYIVPEGNFRAGRSGEFMSFRLVRDTGPEHPSICERCGQIITARTCGASFLTQEKEREKEKQKEKTLPMTGIREEALHDAT